MTLGEAIYAKATSTPALVALIEQRIYPVAIPEPVEQAHVIWQGIGAPILATTHGEKTQRKFTLLQFACFARSYKEAADVRAAIVEAFDNADLGTGDSPSLQDDDRDDYDEAAALFRCDADFLI